MHELVAAPLDALQRLLITEACRDTVLRAAAAADANDAAGHAEMFTEQAVLQRPNAAPIHGRESIRDAYAKRPANRLTRHLVTNSLIEIDGPTRAHGNSRVLLWAGNLDDEAGPQGRPAEPRQLVGEFHDVFALTPQGWRIAERKALFVLFSGG